MNAQAKPTVHPQFPSRFSPRAFSTDPIEPDVLDTLFEAARWAPSSRNEQPWRFLVATAEPDLSTFRGLINDHNRRWADRAPVIAFLLARRHFTRRGTLNRHATFDTGAAWMALALQARHAGLGTHAMAGIHLDEAYDVLGVPREAYEIMCAIAIGRPTSVDVLPEELRGREGPKGRKPLDELVIEGRFPGSEAP